MTMATHAPLALPPGEIHLWLADYGDLTEEALLAQYRQFLSAAEREQEPRFYFERDRRRYLVTRALVRTTLSRYEDVAPAAWQFATNEYGCPRVANEGRRDAPVVFNLSHTHSLIVLAVTRGRAIGVDVENIRERTVSADIAPHFFAPPEVAALQELPADQQQYRFFEYWTFKESYIKARGMGLSLPLDKFHFDLSAQGRVALAIDRELSDDPARWQFWQFRPVPEYLVALCAGRTGSDAPRVTVREVVPLRDERVIAPEFLRTSA